MTTFRNLNVYIKSKELVKQIYELLKKFPREEQYALSDQLRRAVISIPSNIAEGSGRNSQKDQAHFYNIAYGSLMEVFSQLDEQAHVTYYGKIFSKGSKIFPAIESSIILSLSIYMECFDIISNMLPRFIEICEEDIVRKNTII